MKRPNSAFNAQGLGLIIVGVQGGAANIYVATVEALRKKERQDETEFTTKFDGFFLVVSPSLNANVFFAGFLKSQPVYEQTQGWFWYRVFLTLHG
jgi:hypothetical protein